VQVSFKFSNKLILGTTFVCQEKYEYIKQIGHGAYGVVCSALDHSIKAKVAIKKVPKAFEDLIDAKRIVREIKLLSKYILLITFLIFRIL
jgi:serine/threonine protein kinase